MKQEISEKQTTSQQKNSDLEVLNIGHFYKKFLKEKKSYDPSLFAINKKTKAKRKRQVTLKEFRRIISTYLKIYFFELYLNRKTMYFFLGGFMKIVISKSWSRLQKRGFSKVQTLHNSDRAFLLYWYMRPTKKMYYMVKIKKLTGKHNVVPKIEKIFNDNYNKDLLPIFTEEEKKGRINQTLFRCIHP